MAKKKNSSNFKISKQSIRRISWLVALLLVIAVIVSAVEFKEGLSVNEVHIDIEPLSDGNSLINQGDIFLTIERTFGFALQGMPLGVVDVERIERVLKEEAFISHAEVFVDALQNVNISVQQREPILRIIDNNGLNYYLDKDGVRLPLSAHFTARVLTATGNIPPHSPNFMEKKQHTMKDLFQIAQMVIADPFLKPLIEQIHVSNRREFIFIPKVGKQKIIVGSFERIEDKLENLKIYYKEALPYVGWRKHNNINLKYKEQVVGEY